MKYYVDAHVAGQGSITVPAGTEFTIDPRIVVKGNGYWHSIFVDGTLTIGGRGVDTTAITCPVLHMLAQNDDTNIRVQGFYQRSFQAEETVFDEGESGDKRALVGWIERLLLASASCEYQEEPEEHARYGPSEAGHHDPPAYAIL